MADGLSDGDGQYGGRPEVGNSTFLPHHKSRQPAHSPTFLDSQCEGIF